MSDLNEIKFAILAEAEDYDKSLYLLDLTFPRLIEDIVVPYKSDKSFFIDGVPVSSKKLKRIKIIRQNPTFESDVAELHRRLKMPNSAGVRVPPNEYETRLLGIFRGSAEDVTSQIISAYQAKIGDRLKDYIPNKKEFINATFQLFIQSMKDFRS